MLQSLIVSLTPGQVTEPIPLDGGVALFQLRDIEETSYRTPLIAVVDYMTYRILAETPEETLQQAKQVKALTDTCDRSVWDRQRPTRRPPTTAFKSSCRHTSTHVPATGQA